MIHDNTDNEYIQTTLSVCLLDAGHGENNLAIYILMWYYSFTDSIPRYSPE